MRSEVLHYIRPKSLLRAGDRVVVAVSGGADSVALLRVLLELRAELGIVLAVAHFNHGLRGAESEADEAFVADLARQHGLECFVGRANVREHARAGKLSIEAAGRELRYAWLTQLAAEQRFDSIATAHTLDDQAETVLLKFLRGTGTRGLAGIYPELLADAQKKICIIRPLLHVTRDEVAAYLGSLRQSWREDESNLDHRFVRNRVRHELLPLLEREYNPNLRRVLSDTADVSRVEEQYWQTLVERELSARTSEQGLTLANFSALPLALQRRLLRGFAESVGLALDFEHVEQLLRCARGDLPKTELPDGWLASRRGDCLELRPPQPKPSSSAPGPALSLSKGSPFVWANQGSAPRPKPSQTGYAYVLPIPGEVHILELGLTLRARVVGQKFAAANDETNNLLDASRLGRELTIRNWHPGDRFWPLHSGSEEKLKRLFAEKHIPAEQRASWPVALSGEQIIWVRGFPVARNFAWSGQGDALQIECPALEG